MAANPNPPQDYRPHLQDETTIDTTAERKMEKARPFPWGWVAAVIVVICLGLIAYYFFGY